MTLKHKITSFWVSIPERKRQWGLLILCAVIMIFLWDFEAAYTAFMRGYNSTCGDCESTHTVGNIILSVFFGSLILILPFVAIMLLIASFLYRLLVKYILTEITGLVITTFILVLIIINTLLTDGLSFLFKLSDAEHYSNLKEANEAMSDYIASVISFMFICFIVIYSFIKNSFKSKEEQILLLQQKATAEIQALKAQINPHFLFNTLNNLYGTAIVEDSPKTAGGIQQLAGIMRHAVEGSKNDKIGVDKEIKFLHDYIEIQKIRLPDLATISINYEINWDEQPAEIAPLILMTFIENAFKYGISTNQESFVNILLTIDNQQLNFSCANSIVQRTQIETGTETGIDNTRKRLELLYPEKHKLQILEEENEFNVRLTMNLT